MFGRLAKAAKDPRWKGCGFARAAAELAGLPGHPAIAAASGHKLAFEAWLADLLRAEKVHGPEFVARQLMVLLDGAITQILIHRNSDSTIAAGAAAASLIGNAKIPKTKVPPRRCEDPSPWKLASRNGLRLRSERLGGLQVWPHKTLRVTPAMAGRNVTGSAMVARGIGRSNVKFSVSMLAFRSLIQDVKLTSIVTPREWHFY